MTAAWMLYAALVGVALAAAAWVLERAALAAGRAARWGWALALAGSLALPAAGAWRGTGGAGAARSARDAQVAPRSNAWDAVLAALATGPAGAVVRRSRAALAPTLAAPAGWAALDRPLLALWAAASLALLARFARQARASRRAAARWPERVVGGGPVRVSADVGPAVLGVVRPTVVLPAWALGDARLPLALAHEREHVRARDPLLAAAASLACALAPWSPALWWQRRRLRDALELDCDRRALGTLETLGTTPGAAAGAYGRLLLDVAARAPRAAAPGLALTPRHTLLRRRIHAMTRPRPPRLVAPLCAAGAALLAATVYVVPRPAAARAPEARQAAAARDTVRADTSRTEIVADTVTVNGTGADTAPPIPRGRHFRAVIRDSAGTVELTPTDARGRPTGPTVVRRLERPPVRTPDSVLVVVNGRVVGRGSAYFKGYSGALSPDSIASVNVLKGPAATARYGERGRDGVVEITTKNATKP